MVILTAMKLSGKWLGVVAGVGLVLVLVSGWLWYGAVRWLPAWVPDQVYRGIAQIRNLPGFGPWYELTVIGPGGRLRPELRAELLEPMSQFTRPFYRAENLLGFEAFIAEVEESEYPGHETVKLRNEAGEETELLYSQESGGLMRAEEESLAEGEYCFKKVQGADKLEGKVSQGDKVRVLYQETEGFRVITALMILPKEAE